MKQVMAIILLIAGVSAADEPEKSWSGHYSVSVANKNMVLPGAVLNENAFVEHELGLRYGNDQSAWYGIIWWGAAYPEESGSLNDEVDFIGGYEHSWEHVALDASASYFALDVNERFNDDMWVADLKLKIHSAPVIQPFVHIRYIGEVGKNSAADGFLYFIGATRSQRLGFTLPWAEQEQRLNVEVKSGFSAGAMAKDPGYIYTRFSASTNIPLSKRMFVTPSVSYQIAGDDQNGGPSDYANGNELVVKLKVGINF